MTIVYNNKNIMDIYYGSKRIRQVYLGDKLIWERGPVLYAWGLNNNYQLGMGDTDNRVSPVGVPSSESWASVAAGAMHSCAITADGKLYAWGINTYGQLGLGDTTTRQTPTRVGTGSDWALVACGDDFTVAIKTTGEMYSWGINTYGQLGLGDTTTRQTPTKVGSATNWASISVNSNKQANPAYAQCAAINASGELYVWGLNGFSQLGLGDTTTRQTPTKVGSATNWDRVSVGRYCMWAITTTGEAWRWGGDSYYGAMGTGGSGYLYAPTRYGSASNWVDVAVDSQCLLLNSDGEIYSCGSNPYGQIGLGYTSTRVAAFTQVGSASDWTGVYVGYDTSFAVNESGELFGWGFNVSGQIGLGYATPNYPHAISAPTRVGDKTDWGLIAPAKGSHTLAIRN